MKLNKKFQVLAVAGVLTVGIVGGTLAWFTSQDSTTNKFTTGKVLDKNTNGVKIEEQFEKPENMLPGDKANKQVQIKNTASYDQFIRVKLVPKFVDVNNERTEITINDGKKLNVENIKFNLAKFAEDNKLENGHWYKSGDYYYYIGKVASEKHTNKLLDSVTLANDADNEYRGIGFDVDVITDSIQASNGAYKEWISKDASEENKEGLISKFEKLENDEALKEASDLIEGQLTEIEHNKIENSNVAIKKTGTNNLNNSTEN